jgi:hypothetical protein
MALTRLGPNQSINLASNITGTLPTGNGGTGSTATAFVNAATNVTGTLAAANGGTGLTSYVPGKVLQVLETGFTSATATTISAGAGSALLTLDMTVLASSKVMCWFISGETDRSDSNMNPKTTIRVDSSVITSTNGTNHWFYDGSSGESNFRIAITQSALSGALSAGTRTIDVYCDSYGGSTIYNFQNQNEGRLQVMEIAA